MHATINSFYYGVDKLLQRGADVNLIDNQGANALIYCAQSPHITYIRQIAEKTTDINHKAKIFEGGTAIHVVIANTTPCVFASELMYELQDANISHVGCIVIDMDFKMSVYNPKPHGYPGNQEKTLRIIKILTEKGGDINAQNDLDQTPFFLACGHRLKYLVHEIVKQYKLDFSLNDSNKLTSHLGNTSLHGAALLGDTDILQLILTKGININAKIRKVALHYYWQ